MPAGSSTGRRESGDHGESTPQAGRPGNLKRTVTPKRLPNARLRTREHLTETLALVAMRLRTRLVSRGRLTLSHCEFQRPTDVIIFEQISPIASFCRIDA